MNCHGAAQPLVDDHEATEAGPKASYHHMLTCPGAPAVTLPLATPVMAGGAATAAAQVPPENRADAAAGVAQKKSPVAQLPHTASALPLPSKATPGVLALLPTCDQRVDGTLHAPPLKRAACTR